jgi:methionyl-tRNA formyltransferase
VTRLKTSQFTAVLDKHQPDLLISISCPQIIGKSIRDRLPMGCINVHGAPLPRYRGLMPTFWVLRNNESKTATTVHDLTAKLDDGDILQQREIEILPEDTWDSLVRRTKEAGADLLIQTIKQIKAGTVLRRPNPEAESTYFSFPAAADKRAFFALGRRFF